jgi:outer membrane protein
MRVSVRAIPLALLFVAALSGRSAAQAGQKFGYIRSSVLLEQAPGRAEAEAQFDKETTGYREQIKRMSDSMTTLGAAFEKAQSTMSATARDTRMKELQAREAEYQRRTRDLEQRAQQRQNELVQPILDRVKQAIEDVRVEGGYAMIFNTDLQGSPIIAMDKNLDLTDRVLTRLRTTASAPRPATGTPATAPSGVTRPPTPPND